MEKFTLEGQEYTIIDGVMFDAEGEIIGMAERCRPVPDPDKALEYIRNAGKASRSQKQKGKQGPKRKRYTQTLSALLIEDGSTEEQATQIVQTAKKWAQKEGTPGLACTLSLLQSAGKLNTERKPGQLWRGAELEGIAPDNTARNFQSVFQAGANSIDKVTRQQIQADLQK